jgi:hypothetical protein
MKHSSSHILDLTKQGAANRFRELAHELHLLLELFPDLDDAFDPDELPVSFILERAGRSADAGAGPRAASAAARRAVHRKMLRAWRQRSS